MGANQKCVRCSKTRPGRFTRPAADMPGTWGQGVSQGIGRIPYWFCWTCLPHGQGRDETIDTTGETIVPPRKAATTQAVTTGPVSIQTNVNPTTERQQAEALALTLQPAIQALEVKTAEDYQEADTLLGKVRSARKTWGDRLEKVIRPIRTGLDELYKLNREGDAPLAALEEGVKGKMKAFKIEELRLLKAAQDEQDRLTREAEEKRLAAESAKTPQMKGRLQNQAAVIERRAVDMTYNMPIPVAANSSNSRPVKVVRVTDMAKFHKGIAEGYIPEDVMELKQGRLNTYLRDDPDMVEAWPGVTVEDDVQIVGR